VPEDAESYVHRIGRTARAGKAGKAITLACEKFVYGLYAIEKYLGSKIPVMPFDEALLLEDRSTGIRFSRDRGGEGRSRNSRQGVRGYGSGRGGAYAGGRPSPDKQGEPRRGGARRDEQRRPVEKESRLPSRDSQHGQPSEGQGQSQKRPLYRQGEVRKPSQASPRQTQRQETTPQRQGAPTARQNALPGKGQPRQTIQRPLYTPPPSQKTPVATKKIGIFDRIKKLIKKN
jgi:ATP-dependent RNA helicase RhlB